MARTNFGLDGTNCLFLPAFAINADSIVSLMRICTTFQEYAPKMTLDVTIFCVFHSRGVFKYAYLSTEAKLLTNEPRHEISNNVVCATSKGSDQPAHTRSLIRTFASLLNNI